MFNKAGGAHTAWTLANGYGSAWSVVQDPLAHKYINVLHTTLSIQRLLLVYYCVAAADAQQSKWLLRKYFLNMMAFYSPGQKGSQPLARVIIAAHAAACQ